MARVWRFGVLAWFIGAAPAVAAPMVVAGHSDPSRVTCLAVAGDALWLGSLGGGMARVEPGTPHRIRRFDATSGLPGNRVRGCVVRGSEAWAATEAGLAKFDPATARFQTVERGSFVQLAVAGADLVVADAAGRVRRLGPGGTRVVHTETLAAALAGHGDGQVALGTWDGRVLVGSLRHRSGAPVRSLAFAGDDVVFLLGSEGFRIHGGVAARAPALDGALALLPDGSPVIAPTLAELEVAAAVRWRGVVVVATDDGAWLRDASGTWKRLDLGGMPCGDRIVALAEFGGELWAGSFDRGLCRLHDGRWIRHAGAEFLPSDRINDLVADGRHLYVATLAGLAIVGPDLRSTQATVEQCRADPKQKCPYHPSVTGLALQAAAGPVWMADTGAVHRLGDKRWRRFYREKGIASQHLTRIAARPGQVAVGTSDAGLYLGDGKGPFRRLDAGKGLPGDWITDLAFDQRGVLWVGTCITGVGWLDAQGWHAWRAKDGLADDAVLSLREVAGRMWIGTLRGLSIPKQGGAFAHIDSHDGLGGDEVHDLLQWRGRVYVATDGGVSVIRP